MEEIIKRAKIKVIDAYDGVDNRKWLTASLDSYETKDYRIEVFVREGSPQKGFIVANHGTGTVLAFNAWNDLIFKWTGIRGSVP